ncbi:peptidase domain-containing ABC transporter [Xanthomonas oryzae]|uniref:peptidase domain-containing ABC transporter n=1 Tax=Xanthomonas oryzae TaxID=347 RepID=UPI000413A66C|nr:peptidase domain-containing ABC transporter [Xanthomonas oryzae]UWI55988.1 peptidase domain-containing ABC transporter [Xanthomonas oryzae pv. oryzae]UWI56872.1 peptidase domain-containing ABC transporter [Xanthomonas oryzae pv. oryzae]
MMDRLRVGLWKGRVLPVTLQAEASECGIACMAMIACYWGHQLDLQSLRKRFPTSIRGVTMLGLVDMAESCSLKARALSLDLDDISDLATPCILHWNFNHFVVLKRVLRDGIVIHDPSTGRRHVPMREVSKAFTGVALELIPSSDFVPVKEVQTYRIRDLMGRVIGLRRGLAKVVCLGLSIQACMLVLPFYLQWTVDEALVNGDLGLISVLGIGFILLVMMQAVFTMTRTWATTALSTSFNFQWLGNAFSHLMKLPLPYFEKRSTADIVSRFNSILAMQRIVTTQFVEVVLDGLMAIGTLVMMFIYSERLALMTLGAVALYLLLRLFFFGRLRNATSEQIIHAARQEQNFMESVRGIQSIRIFGRGEVRRNIWANALADQFNADLNISRISILHQSANGLVFNLERIAVIWLGALAVIEKNFSVGMLFAYISYKDQFSQRMASLVDKLFEARMLSLHGARVADIVMTPAEESRSQLDRSVTFDNVELELRNVSFRYSQGERDVLHDLNLKVAYGDSVAITGHSGSGKTTLVKLLLGLLEPTSGEIIINGIPINRFGLLRYRKLLGTVMQNDTLFAGSLAENIAFFHPEPDMERVYECARLASISKEIEEMPMQYHTVVGDIGAGLSGGQIQRILLARALYGRPSILVLDEATSHLDIANESAVNGAIKHLELTRIIIAHRPETIASAGRVVKLVNGALWSLPAASVSASA